MTSMMQIGPRTMDGACDSRDGGGKFVVRRDNQNTKRASNSAGRTIDPLRRICEDGVVDWGVLGRGIMKSCFPHPVSA